jgi:O-antigen/teichoic acid export membrane protein
MTRTANCIRNVKYTIFGQIIGIVISFFGRMVFVHILGREYLGLDGLFSNIISVLSIVELGVGTAIVFSMYKPLAAGDKDKLKALMDIYKRTYVCIGIAVAVLGLSLTPFLRFIIKDMPDIPSISLLYLLFVINSSISYFFSYKRSVIIADQKRYIITIYRYGFYFFLNLVQILILIVTKRYLLYLILQIISTVLENIFISKKANKLYPFLLDKESRNKLNKDDKKQIIRNIKAMIYHKLGGTVVMGTDNILISKFVGIAEVGLYSNYQLIINALNSVYGLMFQSLIASIGNLGANEDINKKKFIFECIDLLCFWLHAFSSICLVVLLNPFIKLWLNKEYIFSQKVVMVIVTNFYINGMRRSTQAFKEALGLFWYDRYKPLFESLINLAVSIVLAVRFGITGILLGTIISTTATCFWVEPYILYKYGLKSSVINYFKRYTAYTLFMIPIGLATMLLCSTLKGETVITFCGKLMICTIFPNILFLLICYRTKEFKYIMKRLKRADHGEKLIVRGYYDKNCY